MVEDEKENEIRINFKSDLSQDDDTESHDSSSEAAGVEDKETGEESELEKLKGECKDLNEKYLRLYAEFDNYKKRVVKEKQEFHRYGSEALLHELLTVIDTLEIALSHANDDSSNGLKEGIERTLKEFHRILKKFGLKKLEALGKPFDPAYHEAMSHVVQNEVDEGTVVDEFRKGYMFHDKLLRPSLVAVSKKDEEMNTSENQIDENTKNNEKEEQNG